MIYYTEEKPKVYIETTVVSYLVARYSPDATVASWQRATRQLWEGYANRFEFVETRRGNPIAAQQRLDVLASLTVLETLPTVDPLAQQLLDTGAVPQNFRSDAQHIAIATVHGVEYLVSWNHKHIVNANKREHINKICQAAGFKPITICTPIELIEEFEMKEVIEDYTDPILEECLRMKAEFNAQFNSMEELSAYLKLENEKFKKQGWKYVSYYKPPEKSGKDT